jgi:hypothetical protein
MRTKLQLARPMLSPFLESAFSQLLAELPKSREGYELCKRIESRVSERRKQIWTRKKRPSKGRHRSAKELADRKVWYDAHVEGKTSYAATKHLDEARNAACDPYRASAAPVKTQTQSPYDDLDREDDQRSEGFVQPGRLVGQR